MRSAARSRFVEFNLIEPQRDVAVAFRVEARRAVALKLFECGLAAQHSLDQPTRRRVELTCREGVMVLEPAPHKNC